jgi:hypothetical protein
MKLKMINNNKFFNKNLIFEKEKGENIILGGGAGSGRTELLLQIFKSLLDDRYIDKSSIYITTIGNSLPIIKIISMVIGKTDLNKDNLFIFNALKNMDDFISLNLNNEELQKSISNKHKMFLIPSLIKSSKNLIDIVHSQIYDFIKNLPINNEKEIPIFLDEISYFEDNHFDSYNKIIEKANSKGYYFITSVYGMFNIKNLERNLPIFMKNHNHILMACSHLNLNNNFLNKIKLNKPLNKLSEGEFYYFKNSELENKSLLKLRYKEIDILKEIPYIMSEKEIFLNHQQR